MVIEISDYYKKNGYVAAYLATNKEPRRVCTLRRTDGTMTSMSYAKYLYTSHLCGEEFLLDKKTSRHVQILVVVESVVVLNHTGNNHIIPEDHRFKPCMAHTTRTAEICALNISSKSWQAYFKVFSLHGLINMIVRAP